jgi:hypothetical protein
MPSTATRSPREVIRSALRQGEEGGTRDLATPSRAPPGRRPPGPPRRLSDRLAPRGPSPRRSCSAPGTRSPPAPGLASPPRRASIAASAACGMCPPRPSATSCRQAPRASRPPSSMPRASTNSTPLPSWPSPNTSVRGRRAVRRRQHPEPMRQRDLRLRAHHLRRGGRELRARGRWLPRAAPVTPSTAAPARRAKPAEATAWRTNAAPAARACSAPAPRSTPSAAPCSMAAATCSTAASARRPSFAASTNRTAATYPRGVESCFRGSWGRPERISR